MKSKKLTQYTKLLQIIEKNSPQYKNLLSLIEKEKKQIFYKLEAKKQQELFDLERFNNLNVGDVVYWIEGYSCTLYQFAKVIKKTAKTVIYQSFDYRGMNCTTIINPNTDVPMGATFTKNFKNAYYNKYNYSNALNGHYNNNSD